jgi:hypothetical protein
MIYKNKVFPEMHLSEAVKSMDFGPDHMDIKIPTLPLTS